MVTQATDDMIYYSETGTVAVCAYMDQHFLFYFKETLHEMYVTKLLRTQHFPLNSVMHISVGWGGENVNRLHNNNPMTDTSFQIQL